MLDHNPTLERKTIVQLKKITSSQVAAIKNAQCVVGYETCKFRYMSFILPNPSSTPSPLNQRRKCENTGWIPCGSRCELKSEMQETLKIIAPF